MSIKIKTEIEINATSKKIWNELVNFSSYPEWNPFITSIKGDPIEGSYLKANIGGMKFNPIVLESIPNTKLIWLGKLIFKGLFDGKHSFEIIEKGNFCVFVQSEEFNGILVPLFKNKLNKDTKQGFIKMNKALKLRVETKKASNH